MLKKSFLVSTIISVFAFSLSALDASTIKSFQETLSIEENFSILTHPAFKQFATKNPKQVVGLNQIDLDFINSLKTKYSSLSDRDREKKLTLHDDDCVPQALKVAKFIKAIDPNGKNERTKDLLDEIDFMLAKKKASPEWTIQLSGRLAFALSTPSTDELDLLSHVLDEKSRSQLKEPQDLLGIVESVLGYSEEVSVVPNRPTDYPLNVWSDDMDRLFEKHSATPLPEIVQPIFGEGIISLPILNALAAENVTLMALPTEDKKVNAHGIKGHPDKPGASIAAFASHDALHHKLIMEIKKKAFFSYLHRMTDAAVEKGDSAERFFEHFIHNATLRYRGIHTLLQLIVIGLLEDALDTNKFANFRKAMVGQFYMTHEYPGFSPSTFEEQSATGVLKNLADSTLEEFDNPFAWESAQDPFQTSPFDGSSPLSNSEIVQAFIHQVNEGLIVSSALNRYNYLAHTLNENDDEERDHHAALPNNEGGDEERDHHAASASSEQNKEVAPTHEATPPQTGFLLPLDKIFKTEVKRSARFIDVLIKMKDGNEISHSFPTYYHKWHNLDGTIGLLAYAGIKIEKPELPNKLEEARDICSALLSKTAGLVKAQVTNFVEQSTLVLKKVNTNFPGHSIEEAYKIWMNSLNKELKDEAQPEL